MKCSARLMGLICCVLLGLVASAIASTPSPDGAQAEAAWWQNRGQWLWPSATPDLQARQWVLFRKTLTSDQPPERLPLAISADSVYRLWIGGRLICIGPARSEPSALVVDELDIAKYLRPGANVLAIEVGYAPDWDAGYSGRHPGLFVVLKDDGDAEESIWRTYEPRMHDPRAPIVGNRGPLVEVVDGARVPAGWRLDGFDDRNWPEAVRLDAKLAEADRRLRPRDVPLPDVRRVSAQTIRSYEHGDGVVGGPYADTLPPAEGESFVLQLQNEALMPRTPEKSGWPIQLSAKHDSVTLDLDQVAVGFLAFEVEGPAGAVLDVAWHASLAADGSVRPRPQVQLRQALRYTLRDGRQCYTAITPHAMRYVRLVNRGEGAIVVRSVNVEVVTAPVPMAATFECSDEVLNQIFTAARATATNCALDVFTDNPERERSGWFHDGYWTASCYSLLAGDTAISRSMCRLAAVSSVTHGERSWSAPFVPRAAAGTPLHTLIMPGHSLFWLMQCRMNQTLSGERPDATTAAGIRDLLATCRTYENEQHLLEGLPGWQFLDWARMDERGVSAAMNCLYAAALAAAADMTGDNDYRGHAALVARGLNALASEGYYPDAFVRQEGKLVPAAGRSEATQYYALWSGVAEAERAAWLWKRLRADFVMTNEVNAYFSPDQQPREGLMRAGTYGYMLRLAYAARKHDAATLYRDIRESFGEQLKLGPGTLWEFMGPRAHWGSQTQGVASGVAVHLFQGILGLHYQDGWDRLNLWPGVESGLSFCRGTVPSPHGPIQVQWSLSDRAFNLDYDGSTEIQATLRLPDAVRAIWSSAPATEPSAWRATLALKPGAQVRITPGAIEVQP